MIMTQEQAFLKGEIQLGRDGEVLFVRRARMVKSDEGEQKLWPSLLHLGRNMLEGYIAGVGPGDEGETTRDEIVNPTHLIGSACGQR